MATINSIDSNIPIEVTKGGTGSTTLTNHAVLVGATTSTTSLSVGSNGQVLVGSAGANPAFATLTSSDGSIAFTTGAASLSLQVSGGGIVSTWTVVTSASQTLAKANGYISNRAGLVTYTLPTVAAVGDRFSVTLINSGGSWTIVENASQTIKFGSSDTTATTGSLSSTANGDTVDIICTVANTNFLVLDAVGNITIV